jgi:histidinol-phosphate aminotransferase
MRREGKEGKIPLPDHIRRLTPYVPGKPIDELERELGISGSVKLASNENPLGPSPKALRALSKVLEGIHRYPDGGGYALKGALSRFHGVPPEAILLGNGSNELIELAVRTFLRPGEEAVMAVPSFVVYRLIVAAAGGKAVEVPLREGRHDLEAMAERVGPGTRIVFIANPNNPTGTIVTREEVERLLAGIPQGVLVVLDEAYYEYVTHTEYPRSLDLLRAGAPVFILRTFSKAHGLAGLRIGYGLADPALVEAMNRVRQPFNTNALAQAAALAALEDREHLEATRRVNQEGKGYLGAELRRVGVTFLPSEANFLYLETPGRAQALYQALLRRGVIVRPMDGDHLRVTIGLPEENRRFVQAFAECLRAGEGPAG